MFHITGSIRKFHHRFTITRFCILKSSQLVHTQLLSIDLVSQVISLHPLHALSLVISSRCLPLGGDLTGDTPLPTTLTSSPTPCPSSRPVSVSGVLLSLRLISDWDSHRSGLWFIYLLGCSNPWVLSSLMFLPILAKQTNPSVTNKADLAYADCTWRSLCWTTSGIAYSSCSLVLEQFRL